MVFKECLGAVKKSGIPALIHTRNFGKEDIKI